MEFRASGAAALILVAATASAAHAQVQGVDVSYYQGSIDWGRAKSAGIGFGITRVSDGLGFRDPTFARNWSELRAHGIIRGAYQFFRPNQDPIAQADLLCNAVGRLGAGDLPATCDVEVTGGESGATIVARVRTWCQRVESRTGKRPMVYTAPGFWPGGSVPATLWVANWGVSSPRIPSGWSNWAFWQYTDNGSIPGIPGRNDRDVFHGSMAQLVAFANGAPAPSGSVGSGGGSGVLSEGSSGPAVTKVQQLLKAKGFDPGPIDGSFGPKTLAAVKAFQAAHHLAVDGVVGPQTMAALNAGSGSSGGSSHPSSGGAAPSEPTLSEGMSGGAVTTLQKDLARKGFSPGAADGIFGPKTLAAVKAFQRSRHLAVDGIVGPKTWAALR